MERNILIEIGLFLVGLLVVPFVINATLGLLSIGSILIKLGVYVGVALLGYFWSKGLAIGIAIEIVLILLQKYAGIGLSNL